MSIYIKKIKKNNYYLILYKKFADLWNRYYWYYYLPNTNREPNL